MRNYSAISTAILTFCVGTLLAVPAAPLGEHAKIEQLIQQLGSNNFRQREAATRELDALGVAALAELKKATQSNDMEVATRAKALCEKIEARAENAKLIAPTYVHLKFDKTPVEEAVAEFARQSGICVVIGGDKSHIVGRKVTLDTGRVAFWTALAQFCEKAELVDADGIVVAMQAIPVQIQPLPRVANPAFPIQPIQIQPIPLQPIQIQPIQIQPALPAPAKPLPIQKQPSEKTPAPKGLSAQPPAKESPKKEEVPAPVPVQAVQAAPALQPAMPLRAAPMRRPIGGSVVQNPTTIVLVDGKSKYPSYGESAIRVRALPTSAIKTMPIPQPASDEIGLVINLTAEPRIQVQEFLGVKIEKCLDDCKQDLSMVMAPVDPQPTGGTNIQIRQVQVNGGIIVTSTSRTSGSNYGPNFFPIKLKKSEKETGIIKELSGVASVRMRTPEENLVVVENVLKAKGETAKGKGESELTIAGITKGENGEIAVEAELTLSNEIQPAMNNNPAAMRGRQVPVAPGGGIKIQVQPAIAPLPANGLPAPQMHVVYNNTGLELQDEKGKPFEVVRMQYTKNMWQQTKRTMGVTLTYKPADKEQGEASKLVFRGTRLAAVEIPFVLKDVPVK